MIADLGSEEFERRHAQALNEELAEDLRILYVAVTRAKYRCYLAWADARSEASENNSAMAWLLDFAGADFSRQQSILSGLKEQSKDAFEYRLLDVPGEINSSYQKTISTAKLQAKKRHRQLYTSWQMSSYTALSALTLHEVPELPEDKSGEQQANEPEIAEPVLPKGAHTGNVVHDLLENCAFIDLAERRDISVLREKACQRYDLKLTQPGVIEGLLQAVVTTPLSETDPMFCLMNIPEQQCLKEMPFYLSMQSMDASRINRILQDIPTYQSLNSKEMCGYLTGFIDLVCEYNGLFYVMDYKTNSLADYAHESLIQAMQDHNYGLQYWIYSLVLHLYLQKRKLNYRYDLHFGGVRYLFVRGMLPSQPMSGVYQARPDLKRLESLADVFGINPC
jgi:exodeoxyribonuclease V beta subunit